jgi:HEAT repeat protein
MPTLEQIKSLIAQLPELDPAPPDPAPKGEQFSKGKLTGPPWPDAEKILDAVLAGGKEAVALVIDQITENDIGPKYKPRYLVHILAVYACRPGHERDRAAIIEAIIPQLTSDKPKTTRGFLIRTLQVCGGDSVVPSLAPLLSDPDLADAAAQAMVTLGGDAPNLLRAALPKATGRPRLAIIQALGAMRDSASIEALGEAAGDADENTRITALWSLARTGSPVAVAAILKAAEVEESWPRSQATKAGFVLAEALATGGRKEEALRIYHYFEQSRTADHEAHVREAARRGAAGV